MNEQHKQMTAKFEQLGIPHESIKVFGTIRCNVHVICTGRETANKWAQILGSVFKKSKISLRETTWEAKENHGTFLVPTMRKGFFVSVAA